MKPTDGPLTEHSDSNHRESGIKNNGENRKEFGSRTVRDLLLGGRSLPTKRAECVGAAAVIPIFGLDALGSAAYGLAALTLLLPLGTGGFSGMRIAQ